MEKTVTRHEWEIYGNEIENRFLCPMCETVMQKGILLPAVYYQCKGYGNPEYTEPPCITRKIQADGK